MNEIVSISTNYENKNYLCSMKLVLFSIGLLALGVLGIAIKIWAKKDGEFAGTCASNNPLLNQEGESCSVCGARPDEMCKEDK
tara:strand:- start:398 stop:646 length:249 start_codon:yes stop_codon:yes gene_type:complete